MASKRCGCASDACTCVITAGTGIVVSGGGTQTNPYVLDAEAAPSSLVVQDENTVVRAGVTLLDFQGGGVSSAAGDPGEVIVTIPAPPTVGLWQAYVPTVTGLTLGASTVTGRYTQIGKTVHFEAKIVLGTGFAFTGAPTVTLPQPLATPGPARATFVSAGVNSYLAAGSFSGTTGIGAYAVGTSGAYTIVTATVPFTWKATDTIEYTGTYETT